MFSKIQYIYSTQYKDLNFFALIKIDSKIIQKKTAKYTKSNKSSTFL